MLAGYLKPAGDVDITTDLTLLTIPNKEVQSVFKNEVVSWIGTAFNDTSVMKEIKLAIFENDVLFLKQAIEKYMKSCISYFDTASESFYHGMMLGLLACLSQAYRITSNRESGNGRFDIQMDPLDDNLPAVIIELKVSKDGSVEKLKAMAEEAIKQINEKHYGAGLGTNILKYGIAFHGKDVEIESSII